MLIGNQHTASLISRHYLIVTISRHYLIVTISRHYLIITISRHYLIITISRHYLIINNSRHYLIITILTKSSLLLFSYHSYQKDERTKTKNLLTNCYSSFLKAKMSLDSGFVLTGLCAHTLLYVPCDSKCILGMAYGEIQGL